MSIGLNDRLAKALGLDRGPRLDLSGSGDGMVMLLDALTHRGLCPILLFDDDGKWALSFSSMTAPVGVIVPMDAGDDDVFALIWDESIPMAVALAADAYLKRD